MQMRRNPRRAFAALAVALCLMAALVATAGATVSPNTVSTSVILDCSSGKVRFNGLADNLGPADAIDVTMTTDFGSVGPLHISAVGQAVTPTLVSSQASVPAGNVTFTWDNGGTATKAYSAKDCTPPPPTTTTISAKALTDHECDSTEWHFVITGVSDVTAPASITVNWANGQSASVPLDKVTGNVAHYSTTLNLDSTVTSATATIDVSWDGQFNLSHGPCQVPPPPETCPPGQTGTPPNCVTPPPTPPPTEVQIGTAISQTQQLPPPAAPVPASAHFTG